MKVQKHTRDLSEQDRLDITLMWEVRGILTKFALNYRAFIDGEWHEIYRVDNYHGFLHEQRYWRSPEPIPITDKDGWTLKMVFDMYVDEIVSKFGGGPPVKDWWHVRFAHPRRYFDHAQKYTTCDFRFVDSVHRSNRPVVYF